MIQTMKLDCLKEQTLDTILGHELGHRIDFMDACGVNFFPKGGGNVLLFVVHTLCCSRDLFMFRNLYCNDQLYQSIKGYFPS